MQFIANYWWLIVLPVAVLFWWKSIRRTPRGYWVWLLRIVGIMLIAAAVTWLITGDVENEYVSVHLAGGWRDFSIFVALGVVALLGAQRLALRPPA